MSDKRLYILAGYDQQTEDRLQSIQNRLYETGFTGTQTKDIPLHITLGYYPSDKAKESELEEFIQALAEKTEAFDITLNSVSIFEEGRVLFIAPDVNKKLIELKENFGDSYNWTAHTTMLIDEPCVILEALPTVLNEFSPLHGKITALHLYEFFPTRHIKTVYFK